VVLKNGPVSPLGLRVVAGSWEGSLKQLLPPSRGWGRASGRSSVENYRTSVLTAGLKVMNLTWHAALNVILH